VTGSDHMRMRNRFPHFFLTIVVVQNVPLRIYEVAWLPDVTSASDDVTSGSTSSHLLKYNFVRTDILIPFARPNVPALLLHG
jgi:hypothetical protein